LVNLRYGPYWFTSKLKHFYLFIATTTTTFFKFCLNTIRNKGFYLCCAAWPYGRKRDYFILNKFYSTTAAQNPVRPYDGVLRSEGKQQPIMSLRDIIEYKAGIVKNSPYLGLLKDKENSKYKFGKGRVYPSLDEYSKFKDLCD
jgi:hypothetical protein